MTFTVYIHVGLKIQKTTQNQLAFLKLCSGWTDAVYDCLTFIYYEDVAYQEYEVPVSKVYIKTCIMEIFFFIVVFHVSHRVFNNCRPWSNPCSIFLYCES